MREAWDRTDYERKKENKKREKNGAFIIQVQGLYPRKLLKINIKNYVRNYFLKLKRRKNITKDQKTHQKRDIGMSQKPED